VMLEELKERWWRRVLDHGLQGEKVSVVARPLRPKEAIGAPLRDDYPILKGREVMIQAELGRGIGQAFTDEPSDFVGSLGTVKEMALLNNRSRALLVATINATYNRLGLVAGVRHCRDAGPEVCGESIAAELARRYDPDSKIVMLGYQPAIAHHLSNRFKNFRVTDMDPGNVGALGRPVEIEPYVNNSAAVKWSDVVLATGSSLVNGTIDEIVRQSDGKTLIFFGVTVAAAAYEFGFERLCYSST